MSKERAMGKWIALKLIKAYQLVIGPLYQSPCRFFPSCSQYAEEAVSLHGAFKGVLAQLKTVFKMPPLGGTGLRSSPSQRRQMRNKKRSGLTQENCNYSAIF